MTTLASNLVSIDQLVIELWSKAAGHTVAEGAMVHGVDVELCVLYGRRCCVLCVCQKSVDVEVPKRAILWGEAHNLCLMYPTYIVWYQSTTKDSVLKSNELERMMQRAAFRGINRYYLVTQRIL